MEDQPSKQLHNEDKKSVHGYDKSLNSKDRYTNEYLVPKFVTSENEAIQLTNGSTYQAVLNDELITQEMTKRQRKNYLKNKK